MQASVARTLLVMARCREEIPPQVLGSFAATALRLDEAGTNTRAALLGLDELMDLLPEDDCLRDPCRSRPTDRRYPPRSSEAGLAILSA